jgi:FAD/FMN-containing dehydrogenase
MTDVVSPSVGVAPGESSADVAALRDLVRQLDGRLVLPVDPSWETDRLAWNLAVDQQPAAVAIAGSVGDVAQVVSGAAALGLRVAPQSTGHQAAPMGSLDGTILLRLSEMRGVTIDPEHRTAHVEAGAIWHDVTSAAATYGLAALAGSSHDVGVAGYTLGGGLSWLARSHGLTADHVVALDVVTADGVPRRVSAEADPDLFWALRGGGGSFAVVTALELQLFDVAEVCAGALFFPLDRAKEVLSAWVRWTQSVPDEVMSCGRLLWFPEMPELPPFLSGQTFTVVEVVSTLSVEATDALLEPLRALGPGMDTVAVIPVEQLDQLHMDPPGPVPAAGDGFLLGSCPEAALDAWLAVAGPGVQTPLLGVELRHLGGAAAPGRSVAGGAVDGIDGEFVGYAVGIAPVPEVAGAVNAAISELCGALEPWIIERRSLNFAETARPGEELFGAETYARLRQVKAAYDPRDVIRAHHQVPPA